MFPTETYINYQTIDDAAPIFLFQQRPTSLPDYRRCCSKIHVSNRDLHYQTIDDAAPRFMFRVSNRDLHHYQTIDDAAPSFMFPTETNIITRL
ncbi:hypothetical protein ElyMa_004223200 [Elysia marginata]|uniref:Uncharacterized protein n=1 Tax=Elysia marginata TaxID=1093978 RepID=A0AAV4GQW5_9GAST|nr:hypothetical protein ElyMa_004223200 [Elysia marginata]